MKKMDLHQQQTQSNMTVAFEDLNSLILKAAEMVANNQTRTAHSTHFTY